MFPTMKWENWVSVALGASLIASPWMAGYSDHKVATLNGVIAGGVLVLAEILEPIGIKLIGEWIGVGVGLWLMASPFALGFVSQTVATVVTAGVGLLVVLFAGWTMSPHDE